MSVYFYSRISSITQNSQRQIENFKKHPNYEVKNLYMDKIQGNVPFMDRPQAIKLFDAITSDSKQLNTVVVDSIERLGRSLLDILNTIQIFSTNKINLHSLKEGFSTLLEDGRENPMAKLVVACMGSIGELERNKIKERCTEGIAIAKGAGKYTGRKIGSTQGDDKTLQRHADVVLKLKRGLTVRDISAVTGKSSATITNVRKILVKRNEF
jgi:DNA invertase Pin-like site-specific DNA recombinase